ncbi:MAG TPA: hypothetical protein VN809_16115 [Telmatospirillum sp.]|nr:hypothetical protein [Telmatospirillum sp.]
MTDPTPVQRPINWNQLRANDAERLIKERAADTAKVVIVGHPQDRSKEREILTVDIYRILREGMVLDAPTKVTGGWEAVIRRRIRGTRDAGAATILLKDDDSVIVKTVMWIDQ